MRKVEVKMFKKKPKCQNSSQLLLPRSRMNFVVLVQCCGYCGRAVAINTVSNHGYDLNCFIMWLITPTTLKHTSNYELFNNLETHGGHLTFMFSPFSGHPLVHFIMFAHLKGTSTLSHFCHWNGTLAGSKFPGFTAFAVFVGTFVGSLRSLRALRSHIPSSPQSPSSLGCRNIQTKITYYELEHDFIKTLLESCTP